MTRVKWGMQGKSKEPDAGIKPEEVIVFLQKSRFLLFYLLFNLLFDLLFNLLKVYSLQGRFCRVDRRVEFQSILFSLLTVDPRTGNKVRGWSVYTIAKEHQFEYQQHIFEIVQPNDTTVRKEFITQRRYSFPTQLEYIFSDSGLYVDSVFSGYKKDEPTPKSEQLLYILRKKEQTADSCQNVVNRMLGIVLR